MNLPGSNRDSSQPAIEIAWVVDEAMMAPDAAMVEQGRDQLATFLKATFADFDWRLETVRRTFTYQQLSDPIELLELSSELRHRQRFDYAVLFTSQGLQGVTLPEATCITSRSLDCAVVSLSGLRAAGLKAAGLKAAELAPTELPATRSPNSKIPEHSVAQTASTVARIVMHALGHLGGLDHCDDPRSVMVAPRSVAAASQTELYLSPSEINDLQDEWRAVADPRLEESGGLGRWAGLPFVAVSVWLNRRSIADAVWRAEPWQFPYRLSRLTTAALSTMLILLMTAEAWEVAFGLGPVGAAGLGFGVLVSTSTYVIHRQGLLVQRHDAAPTEQWAATNATTVAIVVLGLIFTYSALFIITWGAIHGLFNPLVVEGWVGDLNAERLRQGRVTLASLVASLGLGIGALGATFESQAYFRHVTFVDEEF